PVRLPALLSATGQPGVRNPRRRGTLAVVVDHHPQSPALGGDLPPGKKARPATNRGLHRGVPVDRCVGALPCGGRPGGGGDPGTAVAALPCRRPAPPGGVRGGRDRRAARPVAPHGGTAVRGSPQAAGRAPPCLRRTTACWIVTSARSSWPFAWAAPSWSPTS